ncbi:unnamed protein product [Symbiodinium sp. CCMP2592]|nr:unnamed protein product [Symbiodinium sp. CCMP2592]
MDLDENDEDKGKDGEKATEADAIQQPITQLCVDALAARGRLHEQARAAGSGKLATLEDMEVKNQPRYIGFLKQFMVTCPPPGRGKPSNKFDFAVLDYEEAAGVRTSDIHELMELCEEDFITYFSKTAPAYQRLTEQGAQIKWKNDFKEKKYHREQRDVLDEYGRESGKQVWVMFVPVPKKIQSEEYKDAAHKLRAQQEMVKAPSDAALDKLREKKADAVKTLMDALLLYHQLDAPAAKNDEALQLVISRRDLVEALQSEKTTSKEMGTMWENDGYLSETGIDISNVKPYAVLVEDRVAFDYAGNSDLLNNMVDSHKESITALRKAGKATSDASKQWLSGKGALRKAQELERKEHAKEEALPTARLKRLAEKDAKQEAKEQAREAAQKTQKTDKEKKENVAAAGEGDEDTKPTKSKTSRLGRGMASELTDTDPAVLRNRLDAIETLDTNEVVKAFAYGAPALVKTKALIKKIVTQARADKTRLQQLVEDAPLPEKISLSSQIEAMEEELKESGKSEIEAVRRQFGNGKDVSDRLKTCLGDDAMAKLSQIVISECRQNSVYSGLNPGPGLASVQYQHSGARLISFANYAELVDIFETNTYSDVLARFRNMTSEEAGQMATLKQASVRPGEMIVLTDGILYTEKALAAHSVSLKVRDDKNHERRYENIV